VPTEQWTLKVSSGKRARVISAADRASSLLLLSPKLGTPKRSLERRALSDLWAGATVTPRCESGRGRPQR
jgi:hypothetical protein